MLYLNCSSLYDSAFDLFKYIVCSSPKAKETILTSADSSLLSQPSSCVLISTIACTLLALLPWHLTRYLSVGGFWWIFAERTKNDLSSLYPVTLSMARIRPVLKNMLNLKIQFHFNSKSICSYVRGVFEQIIWTKQAMPSSLMKFYLWLLQQSKIGTNVAWQIRSIIF